MKALFAQSVVIFLMLAAVPVSLPVSFAAENKCSESEMLLIQRRLDAREAAAKKNFALWDSGFGQLAKEAGKSHALAVTTTGAYLLGLGRAFLRPGTKSNFPNGNKFVLRLEETRFSQAVFKVAENLARKKGAAGVIGNSVLVSLDVVRTSSILSAAGAGAPLFVIGAISSARDHSPIFYQQTSVTTPRLVSEIFRDFDLAHSQVAEQRREATQAGPGGLGKNLVTAGWSGARNARAFSQEAMDHIALYTMELQYIQGARKALKIAMKQLVCQGYAGASAAREKQLQDDLRGALFDVVREQAFQRKFEAGAAL